MTIGRVTLREGWAEPVLLFISAYVKASTEGSGLALVLKGPTKGRPLV